MDVKTFLLLALSVAAVHCDEVDIMGDKSSCSASFAKISCHKILKGECESMSESMEATETPEQSTDDGESNGDDDEKDDDDCKVTDVVSITFASLSKIEESGTTVLDYGTFPEAPSESDSNSGSAIPGTEGATGTSVTMRAEGDDATVTVIAYVATKGGKLTLDDEESDVNKDQVKFSLHVSATVNQTLEVRFKIESRDAPTQNEDDNMVIELGGNAEMVLSKKVLYTNDTLEAWADMESDYPKMETVGQEYHLVLRFSAFTTSAFYDPTIELGDYAEGENEPISGAVTSYMTSSLACLLTITAAMFV